MDAATMVIGAFALLYGIYTLYMRRTHPAKFGKLKAMQAQFGDKTGAMIHLAAYTLLPMVIGLLFLFAGLMGVSLF